MTHSLTDNFKSRDASASKNALLFIKSMHYEYQKSHEGLDSQVSESVTVTGRL